MIEGIKVIKHNVARIDRADDTSYPIRLEVHLTPPDFMIVAFLALHGGSEHIIIRAMTLATMESAIKQVNLTRDHPRLRRFTLTGPAGVIEDISR